MSARRIVIEMAALAWLLAVIFAAAVELGL